MAQAQVSLVRANPLFKAFCLDGEQKNPKNNIASQNRNIVEVVNSIIPETLKKSYGIPTKAATIMVMALAMAELMMSFMRGCDSALALSGGRMGGRSSSNCSSYSISSRYSSYSSGGSSFTKTYYVSKLQVAVYDAERTFRRDLNRIAEKADTSKASGLHRMLSDTTRLLLKHFDSCISGYASVHQQEKCDPAMEFFDKLSLEERENFDEETLVNVDNKRKEKVSSIKDNELSRGHIVVTILVATYGSSNKLPTINSPVDL
eukprot:XP_015576589.1 uncharacterized protein LOC8273833 [Ricinus communis]